MFFRIKKKTLIMIAILFLILSLGFTIWGVRNISQASSKSPYEILVDVESSRMYVFKEGTLYKEYACSGGKPSTPSPIGTWSIVTKGKWGEGFRTEVGWDLMYLGENLEFMEIMTRGSVGWASSHGCIRMKNEEVAQLYKILPIGTKVTIVDGVYGSFGKGFRHLKSGMYGSDVLAIQNRLKELGFFYGYANGVYGSATEEAVKAYCKANKLYVRKTISPELQQQMGFELID